MICTLTPDEWLQLIQYAHSAGVVPEDLIEMLGDKPPNVVWVRVISARPTHRMALLLAVEDRLLICGCELLRDPHSKTYSWRTPGTNREIECGCRYSAALYAAHLVPIAWGEE